MSILDVKTLQSPTNFDLTLDAQGSGKDIIFKSDGTQVASISDAGLLTATTFAGSGASLTALPAAQLTGSLPAISGASLTGLTSSQMPAGSVLQVVSTQTSDYGATGSSYIDAFTDVTLTTTGANKILVIGDINGIVMFDAAAYIRFNLTNGTSSIQELEGHFAKGTASADDPYASFGFQYLTGVLSASTAYTYNVEFKNNQGVHSARVSGAAESLRTLTLMEIQQ